MAKARARHRKSAELHFDVKSGLKRVLGRELITNDEVAIFELVKNSFDASAKKVSLFFAPDRIVIADNGDGMSYAEVREKWLSVAYSSKRASETTKDYRHLAEKRNHYAGSKGIGRFSSDRLGSLIILQTRSKSRGDSAVHHLTIDWTRFDKNDRDRFEDIPVVYEERAEFELPAKLDGIRSNSAHGTIVEIRGLRQNWDRDLLKRLKAALAKLINPFGSATDDFSISIVAPNETATDDEVRQRAARRSEEPTTRDIINGRVGNFIFDTLREKTTFISVQVGSEYIETQLTDRGEVVYSIRERNEFDLLNTSNVRCDVYYLNQSAKQTFARRVGLPSIRFGSVFLFRNGFRVYPIGEESDDWFGYNKRKQQGYNRFLGSRDIIGRVDVSGSERNFQEASSRNQGLIDTPAVKQLREFFMEKCLKRLERYVVPVSWSDPEEKKTGDLSRLLADPGKLRVTAAVASLVDNDSIELLSYSTKLIDILNERSAEFEHSIVGLRLIAEKLQDKSLLARINEAEIRFEDLRAAEIEARRVADEATARAENAEVEAQNAKAGAEAERLRSHFLQSIVSVDTATIINLHHQVTLYSVTLAQQLENFLASTAKLETIPRRDVLRAFEQLSYLNAKIYAVTRFAARATFKLDSEKITTDLPTFMADYIENIAKQFATTRMKVEVINNHSLTTTFNPIDVSIVVDNLISNASKARASLISFDLAPLGKSGLQVTVKDNGRGIPSFVPWEQIFEMGYTTTHSSGLGLYHVRHVLGELGGSIEVSSSSKSGTTFVIKIVPDKKV